MCGPLLHPALLLECKLINHNDAATSAAAAATASVVEKREEVNVKTATMDILKYDLCASTEDEEKMRQNLSHLPHLPKP